MYYLLGILFSLIFSPIFTVITTLWIFLKGIWRGKFYVWEYNGDILFSREQAERELRIAHGEYEDYRFYIWDIWRWRYVKNWWWMGRWFDVKLHTR
jgi:hypothetical protein